MALRGEHGATTRHTSVVAGMVVGADSIDDVADRGADGTTIEDREADFDSAGPGLDRAAAASGRC
jgi:hypothetical protein